MIKYCDLPRILEECAYDESLAANRQQGSVIEDYRHNQRPWPTLIVAIRKTKIRRKLKEIGKTIYMTAYRNHQLRLDEEETTGAEQNQQGNEALDGEETISTNSGSAFSAYDHLEEELQSLTRAQLRARLNEEAPDIDNRGRRGDILRRLIKCIREKEELPQQEDQGMPAHTIGTEEDMILGNDRGSDYGHRLQENAQAAREFIQTYDIGRNDEEDQINIAAAISEQAGREVIGEHTQEKIGNNERGPKRRGVQQWRRRRNKRNRNMNDSQESHDSFPTVVSINTEGGASR